MIRYQHQRGRALWYVITEGWRVSCTVCHSFVNTDSYTISVCSFCACITHSGCASWMRSLTEVCLDCQEHEM